MKKIFAILSFCAVLFSAEAAFALPTVVERVAINKSFFATLKGYDDYFLYDAECLDEGRIGVILLDTLGFEFRLVFNKRTKEVVYRNALIPVKKRRESMKKESISVADAVRIARALTFCVDGFLHEYLPARTSPASRQLSAM